MRKYDAVIAGYLCVDMTPAFNLNRTSTSLTDILKPGKLIEIDGLVFSPGGVVANTGMAMKKFGKHVYLNGLTGDDYLGNIIRASLSRQALSQGLQITQQAGTAFSIVIAPPGVDRIFLESPGCNQIFDISHIDFEVVAQSRLFHFGYPPLLRKFYLHNGDQLLSMLSRIRNMGVITSLDFSLPDAASESGNINWPPLLKRILPYTDIFVPSLEEILQIMMPVKHAELQLASHNGTVIDLVPVDLIRNIGKQLIHWGVKILLIKAGHRGAYLMTGDTSSIMEKAREKNWHHRELWCDAYPADRLRVKNTSGTGDISAAAFLTAILNDESPEIAMTYAAIAGRANLYCDNLYDDLDDWQKMARDMEKESKNIKDLKLLKLA